jgi:hypothetical protein
MDCPACGRMYCDEDNFCAGCGTRLRSEAGGTFAVPVPVGAREMVPGGTRVLRPALQRAGTALRRAAASSAAREFVRVAAPLAAYAGVRLLERALAAGTQAAPAAATPALPLRSASPAPRPQPALPVTAGPPAGLILIRETTIISRRVLIRSAPSPRRDVD